MRRCQAAVVLLLLALVVPLPAAELSPGESKLARKLYLTKCGKCHEFYHPSDYNQADWQMWLQKMRKKSKLKPEQYDLLSRYLDTLRSGAGDPPR